jgi:hypothetical protein
MIEKQKLMKNKITRKIYHALPVWKRDIQIAATWVNTPLLFITFASIVYEIMLKNYLPYWQYLFLAAIIFIPLFKVIGRFVIFIGLFGKERAYEMNIDPFMFERLTPKEQKIIFPPMVMYMKLIVKYMHEKMSVDEMNEWNGQIKILEDAIKR